ncbi:MAG: HAD family phosphatase [Candidatus Saccharibacteria bacterium]|nr:HAD family phosphatase [Candidatus Saccharibacteria bacterium]
MIYKAIGFDWGGVLNGKPGKHLGQEISRLLGISADSYLEAYYTHNKKFNRGDITREELWPLILADLNKLDKVDAVMKLSLDFGDYNPNYHVLKLADQLRTKGYKVGLLSNNSQEKADMMRQKGLDKHFDVFHISAETGFVKPEPEAFNIFAKDLGVELKELIFIDDSEKSLSTANVCGYTPILFDSYQQLVLYLKEKDVL